MSNRLPLLITSLFLIGFLHALPAMAQVIVPDVVDDPVSGAQRFLGRAGLTIGEIINEPSDTIANGNVIRTDPAAGTSVPEDTPVDIYVSSGPENPVQVPDVVGRIQAAATKIIIDADLVVGTVTQQSSATVEAGTVISQDPGAGVTVAEGAAVDLVVSTGPGTTTVPDLIERTEFTAENELEDANLVLGTVTEGTSDAVMESMVFAQSPAAGTVVAEGSAVNITVSTGFTSSVGADETIVPPMAGRPGEGVIAESTLALRLAVWTLNLGDITFEGSFTVAAGNVIRTEPPAGTVVAEQSSVDIIVSSGNDGEIPADVNGDDVVNAVDIQLVINAALGLTVDDADTDVNNDGVTDAVDVQLVINAALGGTPSPR